MDTKKNFWRQKTVWGGLIGVIVVCMVFGLAMMGTVLSSQPRELPVAIVVLDQPVQSPAGGDMAIGQMMQEKLTGELGTQLPVTFTVLHSEAEAVQGMDEQKYYGALVLPENLSAGVLSLQSPNPQQAAVTIYANEGMNMQVATTVKQMLHQVMQGVSGELTKQLMGMVAAKTPAVPVQTAEHFMHPFTVQDQTLHSVGAKNANGNAPGLLTQILWIGSLITSVCMFLASKAARSTGSRPWGTILFQIIAGIVFVAAAASLTQWMAESWYGMEIQHEGKVWLFLVLIAVTFFAIQSTLLNWVGMPAMVLLVLLMFFSMPLLNMVPEMLSDVTRDWLYSWTPLRIAASGLRDVMYFGGEGGGLQEIITILGCIVGAGVILMMASAAKRVKVPGASRQVERIS
ncbi:YhgE/Pip domain-containing protein [Paenibacillus guangzhouensis]|uniref:YhgE/Pip domain-containing protein n=1 Tax=Paenibacillus guangzhouensis TaxID=1473112 RepID=UPI001267707E|nr:ABC transporter permease [Paenibacillus guangzhouensis]